jgi:hypothetical protein
MNRAIGRVVIPRIRQNRKQQRFILEMASWIIGDDVQSKQKREDGEPPGLFMVCGFNPELHDLKVYFHLHMLSFLDAVVI